MFDLNFTLFDILILCFTLAISIYLIFISNNPFEKGTDDYQALHLCRISLGLLIWSFQFGLVGFAFALTSFILAIIGIVKGRTLYGIFLIIGSVCLPIISVFITFSNLFR